MTEPSTDRVIFDSRTTMIAAGHVPSISCATHSALLRHGHFAEWRRKSRLRFLEVAGKRGYCESLCARRSRFNGAGDGQDQREDVAASSISPRLQPAGPPEQLVVMPESGVATACSSTGFIVNPKQDGLRNPDRDHVGACFQVTQSGAGVDREPVSRNAFGIPPDKAYVPSGFSSETWRVVGSVIAAPARGIHPTRAVKGCFSTPDLLNPAGQMDVPLPTTRGHLFRNATMSGSGNDSIRLRTGRYRASGMRPCVPLKLRSPVIRGRFSHRPYRLGVRFASGENAPRCGLRIVAVIVEVGLELPAHR